jgi:hypothetical protein
MEEPHSEHAVDHEDNRKISSIVQGIEPRLTGECAADASQQAKGLSAKASDAKRDQRSSSCQMAYAKAADPAGTTA